MAQDEEPNADRGEARALLPWLALATAVYIIGRILPLPGVDHDALTQMASQSGLLGMFGHTVPMVGVVGGNAATLVLVQVILIAIGRIEHARFRLAGAALFVVLTAVQGVAIAFSLEGMNDGWIDVVMQPGWGFRFSTALAMMAGGAVLWWVFERIDRTQRAHGAFFLALLLAVENALDGASAAGPSVAQGALAPLAAVAPLAPPLAAFLIAAVLLWRPVRWPVRLFGGVRVRSGWDVVGIGALGILPTIWLTAPVALMHRALPSWGVPLLGVVAAFGVALTVILIRLRHPTSPGARREWALALGSLLILFLSISTFGVGMATSGAIEAAFAPGPLEGEARFGLTLEADGEFAPGDGEAMIQRLTSLGAEARIENASATQIEIAIDGASGMRGVIDALTPRRLELRFGYEFGENPLRDRAELSVVQSATHDLSDVRAWQGPCAVVAELVGGPSPDVCTYAIERARPFDDACTLHCVEHDVILTGGEVADASVGTDPMIGTPLVLIELTDEAAEAFEEATATHLRRALVIVIDGEVMSAPIIQSAIPGGRLQVTLGSELDAQEMLSRASNLANALQPGAQISTSFTVVEERMP